jgi:CRP/FNR family transcriptional regulator
MNTIELLKTSYLCRQLEARDLNALADIVSVKKLARGEVLFLQGDEAKGFYILFSGGVRIYKLSPEGKEYTLHRIRPGDMFAEAAIFKGRTFPANCIAAEASVVAFVPKARFVELLTGSPNISLRMIGALSAFVRDFNQQIADLSLREVPARLASHLLALGKKSGSGWIRLDTTKTELATTLGTTSETLSRNLRKLRDLRVVSVKGNTIEILDPTRLQSIANGEKT